MVCDTYYRKLTAHELRRKFPSTDYIRVIYKSDPSMPVVKTRILFHFPVSKEQKVSSVRNYLTGTGANDYGMSLDTGTLYTAGPTVEEHAALFSLMSGENAFGIDEDGDPGANFKANFDYALRVARQRNELDQYKHDAEKFRDAGNSRVKTLQTEIDVLKAALAAQPEPVGQKRPRELDDDLLANMQHVIQSAITAAFERDRTERNVIDALRKELADTAALLARKEEALNTANILLEHKDEAIKNANILLEYKEQAVKNAIDSRDRMHIHLKLMTDDRARIRKRAVKTSSAMCAGTSINLDIRNANTPEDIEKVKKRAEAHLHVVNVNNYLAMPPELRTTPELLRDAMLSDPNDFNDFN